MSRRFTAALLGFAALAGCQDGFDRRPEVIDRPRILAVVAEPPERRPGEASLLRAVVAAPGGELDGALDWSLCRAPRPLADGAPVAQACLDDDDGRLPLARAPVADTVVAAVPLDACAVFGSEPPPPTGDQPARRPVDPDPTGGHYQPVRVATVDDEPALAIGFVRIRCALAGAPAELARRHAAEYPDNQNPVIAAASGPASVRPGASVELSVVLSPGAAEPYLVYDPRAVALVERTEELAVSVHADGGELAAAGSPVTGEIARVRWRAPREPGAAQVWFVVRDDRGGAAAHRFAIAVE
jgi:hypothetical protein